MDKPKTYNNKFKQEEYMRIPNHEARVIYCFFILFFIAVSVFIGGSIMYIVMQTKDIIAKHPNSLQYILICITFIICYKFNVTIQKRLKDYLVIDWYLIRNLLYFMFTLIGIVCAALYLCNLLI